MDWTRVILVLAVVGGFVAIIAGAALPTSIAPTYNAAVYDTGPVEWNELSSEAQAVVETALGDQGTATNVTFGEAGSYGNGTNTEFGPYPDDLPRPDIDQAEPSRAVIVRNGTVLVFTVGYAGSPRTLNSTFTINAANRTDTALLRRDSLSAHGQAVLDQAMAADESVAFYTPRPTKLREGIDATPSGLSALVVSSADLFIFPKGTDYQTVVLSAPITFVPLGRALTAILVVGSLATVPAVTLYSSQHIGRKSAAATGVVLSVAPVFFFRVAAVGSVSMLSYRLLEFAHLIILTAIGALLCAALVLAWQPDTEAAGN